MADSSTATATATATAAAKENTAEIERDAKVEALKAELPRCVS